MTLPIPSGVAGLTADWVSEALRLGGVIGRLLGAADRASTPAFFWSRLHSQKRGGRLKETTWVAAQHACTEHS